MSWLADEMAKNMYYTNCCDACVHQTFSLFHFGELIMTCLIYHVDYTYFSTAEWPEPVLWHHEHYYVGDDKPTAV